MKKEPKTGVVSKKTQHKNVQEALFAFQSEKISIQKTEQGKSSTGETYMYASLESTINGTLDALQKNKLMITQIGENGNLVTRLYHVDSDTEIISALPIGAPQSSQDLGARITYLRRYMYNAILGLANEDVDGSAKNAPATDRITAPINIGVNAELMKKAVDKKTLTDAGIIHPEPARSAGWQKAHAAVMSADSPDGIELVRGQLARSKNITDPERAELLEILKERDTEINGTVHIQ